MKPEPRRYHVVALRPTTLLCLPLPLFATLRETSLGFNQFLVQHLNMRLGQAMTIIEAGRTQFHRTCAQCHGRNMVNSGTTVYDLRKFPTEQRERFYTSVVNGKGNMPSFKGALEPESIELLWTYVATRGGKEL